MRIEQEPKLQIELAAEEIETLTRALQGAVSRTNADLREGDVNAPEHPRRIQLVLTKLRGKVSPKLADH
jgi:DNA-binding transcriptional regulator YdaS (Cro superfamily)